jgi:hypothetical protein
MYMHGMAWHGQALHSYLSLTRVVKRTYTVPGCEDQHWKQNISPALDACQQLRVRLLQELCT